MFYKRIKLETRLKDVFKYPLTVVTAPLGYGKTVLVREFLKDQKADVFWAALDEGDRDKGYFVRRFISLLREGNEESAPGLEQVIEFIKEAAATRSYVLVLDGYEHVAEMDWMNNLIKELIKEPIYHFHIIVISRTMPYMNIEELRMKRVCQVLDEGDLRFDLQEVEEYLRINGLEGKIHPEEAYESSDGWIGAMTLMKEHKGIYGMVQEIYQLGDLLEEEILQKYDHLERDLLIVAAHLDEFKIKDLGEFGVDINSATILKKWIQQNAFIQFNRDNMTCKVSRIFAQYLQRRCEEAESEGAKILYKQLGEWYIAKGDWQKAIVYWIKGGDQELVLKRLSELEMSQLGALDMNQMIELYDGLSLESIKKYPVAYIYLTYFKMMREPLEKGRKLVEEVSLYMSQQEECEQLEGKLNLLKGILSFNQLGELFAYLDRIPESDIDRSSRNRLGELILMDNLGVSAIYHTKRGQYKEVVKQIAEKTELGLSYVTHAEYLMYQGKWKESEIMAMKAYFQAEISGCHKVMVIARYIQMRVYLVTGQKAKCQALLEESKMLKLKMKNNVLREMIDIQRSYLYYKLGEIHQVPLKFQKGEEVRTSQDVLGVATNNIIYVQALLERQEYVKVEIWSENILRHCKTYGNVVGLTCGTLFNAIAKSHIYGESEGKEKLLEAIEWGYQDGIIMPFVEQYKEIEACLRGIQVPAEQEAYFQKIKQHGMHFVEVSGKDEIVIRPSKESVFNDRETEILEYLRQGLTNQEIGNILHIAKVTVAKSITNIYRKMGVSNRIEAIQFLTE